MRTMRFRRGVQPAQTQSQCSDQYDLFCEGLKSQIASSSSMFFTSTPEENEDNTSSHEEELNSQNVQEECELKLDGKGHERNASTEVLIGSAGSPCAPLEDPTLNRQVLTDKQQSPGNPEPVKASKRNGRNCDEVNGFLHPSLECRPENNFTSTVDCVDHRIVVTPRDENVVKTQENLEIQTNSTSGKSATVRQPAPSTLPKNITSTDQDSSETDFEDANYVGEKAGSAFGNVDKLLSSTNIVKKHPANHVEPNITIVKSKSEQNKNSTATQNSQSVRSSSANNNSPNSDFSEDLLNPSIRISKPRSSASSDGIRLRLSASDSGSDCDEICNSENQSSHETLADDVENDGAARCRPFQENPLNLNQKISRLKHSCSKYNQENASMCRRDVHYTPSINSDKLITNGEVTNTQTSNHSNNSSHKLNQASRSALISIPVEPMLAVDSHNLSRTENSVSVLTKNSKIGNNSEPTSVLRGVVAYVEVRSGHDNRSRGVRSQLCALGAEVVHKFCRKVTHVVFNEGSLSIFRRAQEQGCHLVSVLWIDACKTSNCLMDESNYPPLNLHLYSSSTVAYKHRKLKSLQPDFDEDKCEERINKHLKRIKRKAQQQLGTSQSQETSVSINNTVTQPSQDEIDGIRVPSGVKLKRLSIVLKKMGPIVKPSEELFKRKLMPVQQHRSDSAMVEEPDFQAPLSHKGAPPLRRSLRQTKDSETQRGCSQKRTGNNTRYESRRSSVFIPRKPKRIRHVRGLCRPKMKMNNKKFAMRTMVCTFMHRREIDVVAAVLKQLGGWILESTVSSKTTHVICGDAKRTLNLLRGFAHGSWILHKEWVFRSIEAGRWLDEEPYELTAFPAARQCRIQREALGVHPNTFSAVGGIYVSEGTSPPKEDLVELLQLCGAQIVSSARQAQVIVGEMKLRSCISSVALVKELWVLDSIQENMLKSMKNYLVSSVS